MSQKTANKPSSAIIIIFIIAVVAVVGVAAIFISQSGKPIAGNIDYSQIPQQRLEDGGYVLGNPEAYITIVAFEDFMCPHCQDYTREVLHPFVQEMVTTGKAKYEYRMFPAVDPTFSPLTAKLAECADTLQPGSFWLAHDTLFDIASSERFSSESARKFATKMNISYASLLDCQESISTSAQIFTDQGLGEELGVQGTPTIFVRFGDDIPRRATQTTQPTLAELKAIVNETPGS
ncbi:hypothetical protein MASR2M15_14370 [Anaerolineales bacterium]